MTKTTFKRYLFPIMQNESGIALIISLLTITLLTLLGTAALTLTEIESKISANDRGAKEAFYIAEAGIEHARAVLRKASFNDVLDGTYNDNIDPKDNGVLKFGSEFPFGNGNYNVTVDDNKDEGANLDDPWIDQDGTIIVTSTGTSNNGSRNKIEIVLSRLRLRRDGIKGSVTSNSSISTSGSSTTIDGRDHDSKGDYIPDSGSGILGISTKGSLNQKDERMLIGGTDSFEVDWEPPINNPSVIEEEASWTIPTTPEEVLGLTVKDQLKILAKQHVTDPSGLTFPLSGITYVELPEDDNIWNTRRSGVDFKDSSGILIVHNSTTNAFLENTHGTFRGVIIADNYVRIHNTIIGAVVILNQDLDEEQIGNGNGQGKVLYSNDAITNALNTVSNVLITESWREVLKH